MKKILWISLCTPYRGINHAGGQALYRHVKAVLEHDEKFAVRMVSFCGGNDDFDAIKQDIPEIDIDVLVEKEGILDKLIDLENRINPWNRFGGYLSNSRWKLLKNKLNHVQFEPDVIILNWTEMIAAIEFIKKKFPSAKTVCVEEDISFQKRERRAKNEKALIKKQIFKIRAKVSKEKEVRWLSMADRIVVYNKKDSVLLNDRRIDPRRITVLTPTFMNMSNIRNIPVSQDILYWGAMNRNENIESVSWLIDKVCPLISDLPIRLVVIGNAPPENLKSRGSDRIVFTGYVQEPGSYFRDAICFVAPIQMGAGIKIKVLEAMSTGLPVITNSIGIEGIEAKDKVSYIHAELPQEFADAIRHLYFNRKDQANIGIQGRKLIEMMYSGNGDNEFVQLLEEL